MSLSLTSEVHVFPCSNCRETINTSMQTCTFCNARVDYAFATAAAEETARINAACSDGSFIRTMAWALIPFFFLQFIPMFPMVSGLGFLFLIIAIPVMSTRWWIKYGSLDTTDATFRRARLTTGVIGAVTSFFLLIRLLLFVLVLFAVRHHQLPT